MEVICASCKTTVDNRTNRIVTENCGHNKCRNCFITEDDGCRICHQNTLKVSASENDLEKRRKPMPAHIVRISSESQDQVRYKYGCLECKKYFHSRSQQYYHLNCATRNSPKKYKCKHDGCEKSFATNYHLKYHLQSHNTILHKCTTCGKGFQNSIVLQRHEQSHNTVAIPCGQCGKQFKNKTLLSSHLKANCHEKKTFYCTYCSKMYQSKTSLQQHLQIHTKMKRFECYICHKQFHRKSTLTLHVSRHSNIKKFKCDSCYSQFSDSATLIRHVKLHTDHKTYLCKVCGMKTNRKDNMQRHLRHLHSCEQFEENVEVSANAVLHTEIEPLPKTVENSSVIKSIGKVDPVIVPSSSSAISTATIKKPELAALTTESRQPAKQYLRYLKILKADSKCDGDLEAQSAQTYNNVKESSQEARWLNTTNSDFTQKHWRKNFKHAYESTG